jgi:sarcosine oxidase, subunit alpha
MLRESGVIFDDGTVVMLAPDRWVVTTTSGNARRVAAWFEEWHQCEWPDLRVAIVPVTESWACFSLAGPRTREILASLDSNMDLSTARHPHLGMCEGRLLDHPVRLYRVSFTGELAYEINVRAGAAPELWNALLDAGKPHGIQPFGLDALLLMRLEKGFLHVGTDTDGTTVPDDVGWGRVAANKRGDYIGKRSLWLPEHRRTGRLQLVGLKSETDIVIGGHLRLAGSTAATDGWVTSAGRSVMTDEPIALAMLRGGRERIGAQVLVHDGSTITQATIVAPPFYDATGERMNA